jgi:hypothetical protein
VSRVRYHVSRVTYYVTAERGMGILPMDTGRRPVTQKNMGKDAHATDPAPAEGLKPVSLGFGQK